MTRREQTCIAVATSASMESARERAQKGVFRLPDGQGLATISSVLMHREGDAGVHDDFKG